MSGKEFKFKIDLENKAAINALTGVKIQAERLHDVLTTSSKEYIGNLNEQYRVLSKINAEVSNQKDTYYTLENLSSSHLASLEKESRAIDKLIEKTSQLRSGEGSSSFSTIEKGSSPNDYGGDLHSIVAAVEESTAELKGIRELLYEAHRKEIGESRRQDSESKIIEKRALLLSGRDDDGGVTRATGARERKSRRGGSSLLFDRRTSVSDLATKSTEIHAAAALLALVPSVGRGLSKIATKTLDEGGKYQTALYGLDAATGIRDEGRSFFLGRSKIKEAYKQYQDYKKEASDSDDSPFSLDFDDSIFFGGASSLGFSESDFLKQQLKLARKAGIVGEEENARESLSTLAFQRAFNVSGQDIDGISGFSRTSGRNPSETLIDILNVLKSGDLISETDFKYLPELLSSVKNLTNLQASRMLKTDPARSASILASLSTVFGADDPRLGTFAQGVDSGLTGGNQFMKALQLASIADIDPNMDIYEMYKVRQQGLTGERGLEYFSSFSKRFLGEDGTPLSKLMFSGAFPNLNMEAAEKLFEKLQEDPDFMKGKSLNQALSVFTTAGVQQRGEDMTTPLDRRKAGVDNLFAGLGDAAINLVDYVLPTFKDGLETIIPIFGEAADTTDRFTKVIKKTSENLENLLTLLRILGGNPNNPPDP